MQKVLGGYAILLAVAVAINFVATPLYHSGQGPFVVWEIFNWFMAPAALIALGASGCWKFCREQSGDTGRGTGALFWASVVLALWFFWNWFGNLMDRGGDVGAMMWAFIDPLFVVVVGAAGLRLWRGRGSSA